ncbi:MAG TPA: nitrous oxide reductase accessory protein NosL [Fimbriiglobus sp.]|nr:nitrous oxide reductase accessory protein NosL [Fimbriiglobus sp.]
MKRLPLLAALTVAAFGCGGDGPPNVRYGQEECAHCRMIVNDDRFAAAVTTGGEAHKFDEVGCLIDYLADHSDAGTRLWVRGYRSETWLDARAAYFAHGPKLQTPMGAGLAAAATKEEADALAAEWGGRVLRFDELAEFLKKQAEAGSP